MDDMVVALWSKLPPDVVDRMLSFLSVPVLCRFRTVCKRWNSLISKPEFGALCIHHARHDSPFIVLRHAIRGGESQLGPFGVNHGWSFLDLSASGSAKRWYTIEHDEQPVFDSFKFGRLAMDGGLVYQHMDVEGGDASVFVSNPLAKTSTRLPPCTAIARGSVVNMLVDNIAHSYKVFVIPSIGGYGDEVRLTEEPIMVVYESTTKQWRNTTNLHTPRHYAQCSVFLDGLLYVLMFPDSTATAQENCLWSYDHVEDVWKDTGVMIHIPMFISMANLVVIDNRLFLASWVHHGHPQTDGLGTRSRDGWSYEVSEVHLEEKTHVTVFEMPEAVVKQVFELSDISRAIFHVIGFCKSFVMLCKPSGVSVVFDLNTALLETLPANPSVPFHGQGHQILWYGSKPMKLILPQWDHQQEVAGIQTSV